MDTPLVETFKRLKLYGMASALSDLSQVYEFSTYETQAALG
jgi:hypothetical protein